MYADGLSHRHQAPGLRAQAERIDRDAFELGFSELGIPALVTGLATLKDDEPDICIVKPTDVSGEERAMPTGPQHYVLKREDGPSSRWDTPCRCMIGSDHDPNGARIWDSTLERWDREEGRGSSNANCPACGGAGACALCDDD